VRSNTTAIGALALQRGEADAMLCGLEGRFATRLNFIRNIIGLAPDAHEFSTMSLMITPKGAFFLADTHVRQDPTAEEIADMTLMIGEHVRRFGLKPKIALISHSDFGAADTPSARKMRTALRMILQRAPDLEVDGEMQADTALSQFLRDKKLPSSRLKGEANVLIMPNLDAANIAYQLVRTLADALPVGPILLGAAKPAHILSTAVTARGIVNMTAIAVAEAQAAGEGVLLAGAE
jgi:malate dehydrogenase (oxaloacetate-decarboxylating)(NADP+)